MMNSSLQFQYLSPQVGFSSVISGGQSDLSLIPQGLCQSKFHQLMPKVSVCSRALRFNEFDTGHQAALRTCIVLNHLCPNDLPESTMGERSKLGDALLAPLTGADRPDTRESALYSLKLELKEVSFEA